MLPTMSSVAALVGLLACLMSDPAHAMREELALPLASPPSAWMEGEFDLTEIRISDNTEDMHWESTFSYGTEDDRAVMKFDGHGEWGRRIGQVETQLLYSHRLSLGTALLAGVRHRWRGSPHDSYATLGIETELNRYIAAESYAFLSDQGDLTGEAKLFINVPLHDKLLADARAQIGWSGQAIAREDIAAGLNGTELSLRLRYTGSPHIEPYLGVIHSRLLGKMADIASTNGVSRHSTLGVVGLSFAFSRDED